MIEWLTHLGTATLYMAYAAIIFAESGLLIGVLLPGDSLLFTVGILAATGRLSVVALLVIGSIAAILGDQAGYRFGYILGDRAFTGKRTRKLIKKEHVEKTQEFYAKYGPLTLILARFSPFARTIAPILAGVGKMPYGQFSRFNIIGGISWVCTVTLFGYFLGNVVHNPEMYLLPILAVILLVSTLPAVVAYIKNRLKKSRAAKNTTEN